MRRSKVHAWDYLLTILREKGLVYYGQGIELSESQQRVEEAVNRLGLTCLTIEQIEVIAELIAATQRVTQERN